MPSSTPNNTGSLPKARALVVIPESREAADLQAFLSAGGYEVTWARDGEMAYNVLDETHVDVLVTHLNVHRIDGMKLLHVAKQRNVEICAVMIADRADVELATEAMRQGAYDFQCRPLNLEKMVAVLDRGISHQRLKLELTDIQRRMDERFGFHKIVGHSERMRQVYQTITQISRTNCTVLISGETGTGKELVAQAIHQNSPRANGPFVGLNCGALAEGIVESELFGHERGAFTGASQMRKGRWEIADGGTLFLDEAGEIPPSVQVKLLRLLETGEFERLGGRATRRADVRLLAATNRDPAEMVREGSYRRDLFYRLNVVRVHVPPLRERKEDLPILVDHFIREFSSSHDKRISGITRGAVNHLLQHDWPGNVRELKNCIEGMVVMASSGGRLGEEDIPGYLRQMPTPPPSRLPVHVGMALDDVERLLIAETLRTYGFDKQRTARVLGIGLRTLYRKIKLYGLE
jgi:DNA-binding NtrC family response regulator